MTLLLRALSTETGLVHTNVTPAMAFACSSLLSAGISHLLAALGLALDCSFAFQKPKRFSPYTFYTDLRDCMITCTETLETKSHWHLNPFNSLALFLSHLRIYSYRQTACRLLFLICKAPGPTESSRPHPHHLTSTGGCETAARSSL